MIKESTNNLDNIYYIHGYESSPEGSKGTLFSRKLDAISISYRDCKPEDLDITDCLRRILITIGSKNNVILIGSSLGGFLAAKTALENKNIKHIILLNPSLIPPEIDIATIHGMPLRILKDIKDDRLFTNKINSKINILAGIFDKIVPMDWILNFAKAQESTIKFLKDDHRFSKNLEKLPDIISEIIISTNKKH